MYVHTMLLLIHFDNKIIGRPHQILALKSKHIDQRRKILLSNLSNNINIILLAKSKITNSRKTTLSSETLYYGII